MKVELLVPPPGSANAFDYSTLRSIPNSPGCYALINAGRDIIYIGQATSLRHRLQQHLDTGRHHRITVFGRATMVCVLPIERVSQLNAHERGWLNQCELTDGSLPPLNKVHAPA